VFAYLLEKAHFFFGHDECIFKQYLVTKKSWVGSNGKCTLIPKDDGQGVMISTFQSREASFGLELLDEQLTEVIKAQASEKYKDEEAAVAKCEKAPKDNLLENLFVKEFEYGTSGKGYWCYQQMVLQLEDCIDVLKVVYPQFNFLFLFDHSCGHDKQREDGFNIN